MTAQPLRITPFVPASFQGLTAAKHEPKLVATANKPGRDYVAELETMAAKIFQSGKGVGVYFIKDSGVSVDVEKAFIDKTGKIYAFHKPGVELRPLTTQIAFLMDGARRVQLAPFAPVLRKFEFRIFPTEEMAASQATKRLELEAAAETRRADAIKAQQNAEATKKAARIAKAALAEAKRLDKDFGACKTAPKAKKVEAAGKKKGKK